MITTLEPCQTETVRSDKEDSCQLGRERRPLRVMFVITSMPVGGAETLLVNLIRRMDRSRFEPEVCCLKERGPLGDELSDEIPVHHRLLRFKYDLLVCTRLTRLLRKRRIDAVVTVGAGDKMFWGRLAARWVGVPVVVSALHSTGWPDGIGRLNRMLTPLTDAFVGVALSHGEHLVDRERLPRKKVCVIPNGVDAERFSPQDEFFSVREELGLASDARLVITVAALRPEKNHQMLLQVADRVIRRRPDAHFLVVGDGPERKNLEESAQQLGLERNVHFLGTRKDVPRLLSASDVFALTSDNEANPISILEAMGTSLPVVATNVGSVRETVLPCTTGFLVDAGDPVEFAERVLHLLSDPVLRRDFGRAGRRLVVERWSLEGMVDGYEQLLQSLFVRKTKRWSLKQRARKTWKRLQVRPRAAH